MVLPDVAASVFEGEAEIAVVIGKRASKVSAADAMKYVFGYTNFIDGSARGLAPPAGVFFASGFVLFILARGGFRDSGRKHQRGRGDFASVARSRGRTIAVGFSWCARLAFVHHRTNQRTESRSHRWYRRARAAGARGTRSSDSPLRVG